MEKVAIVILNYLNYQDTIECIDSIKMMNYDIAGVVVVDNASSNESYAVLKKKYKKEKNICIIKTKSNLGFARGNNAGINYARKRFDTKYIFVVNNDVIFEDKFYFKKLLQVCDESTGVVGSKIVLNERIEQKRFEDFVTFKEVLNIYLRRLLKKFNKEIWSLALPDRDEGKRKEILHGCGLLFTPIFFKYYKGFYPRTFLYCEEHILYLMCERYKLKQKYVDNTYIFHKEDKSSEMSFGNNCTIMDNYSFQSYKYVVWWAFKNMLYMRRKNNG